MTTNDDASTQFEESDLISLGQKLAALDLTEPERNALSMLISDDDVAGFARFDIIGGINKGWRPGLPSVRVGKRANELVSDWGQDAIDAPKPGRF